MVSNVISASGEKRLETLLGIIDRMKTTGLMDDVSEGCRRDVLWAERKIRKALKLGGRSRVDLTTIMALGVLQGACGSRLLDIVGDDVQLVISLDFTGDRDQRPVDQPAVEPSWHDLIPEGSCVTWRIKQAPLFFRQLARMRVPDATSVTVCHDPQRFDFEPSGVIDAVSVDGFTMFFS